MAMKVRAGGALRTITGFKLKQAGVLRTIIRMRVMDGGVLRQVGLFTSPLSLEFPPVGYSVRGDGQSTLTTAKITANPQGGLPPFSYQWTLIANGGRNPSTAATPTMAGTTFTKTGLTDPDSVTDTWRCTVTDSLGATVSANTFITFLNPASTGD